MTWTIDEAGLPSTEGDYLSTIFTVGNGQICTRGTLAEERFEAFRGTYVSGLYTRAGYGLAYLLMAPDWLCAYVAAAGGRCECTASQRTLDMRTGVLTRTATFRHGGAELAVTERRFCSLADASLLCQRLEVKLPAGAGGVDVVLGIDGEVRNHCAKYYAPGQLPNVDATGVKLSEIEALHADGAGCHVVLRSRQSGRRVGMAGVIRQVAGEALPRMDGCADGRAGTIFQVPAGSAGRSYAFEKLVRLDADFDGGGTWRFDAAGAAAKLAGETFESAAAANAEAWAAFWHAADVEIDGDEPAQRAVRFAVYSTRIAAPDDGGRSSLGAKNLTGDWYRGAVFWDMELYQLPLLTAAAPELARNHVCYRARRLDAARVLAAQDGYDGARFPWQSYRTGLEEPPVLGGFLYQQVHLNAAVPWGILHYWHMTGDVETFAGRGLEVLVEQCRYWASRATEGPDGVFHVRGVCGPDEIHQLVDDNAYTNRMAAVLLRYAAALALRPPAELAPAVRAVLAETGVTDQDVARWRRIADGMHAPTLPGSGVLAQFAGFEALAEPSPAVVEQEGPGRDRTGKQADVLMLFQALPADERFGTADAAAHYAEYAPLCTQTSSLSLCTHALAAARLGRLRDAMRYFEAAAGVDLADSFGNTRHGIHGAGEGGVWLAVVQGFGGLGLDWSPDAGPAVPRVEPRLPPPWRSLAYGFHTKGRPVRVTVRPDRFTVANRGGRPVRLVAGGAERLIAAGQTMSFPCEPAWQDQRLEGVIFDLDGVLVSTDRFHYVAWKELADELSLPFDEEVNHQLRGVGRTDSLKRIYRHSNVPLPPADVLAAQCAKKNARYRELIGRMTPREILPGSVELLAALREARVRCALASASRNAGLVLERTGLAGCFDAVSDGTCLTASKPDPQGFLTAARRLRVLPWNCIGVEDADSGIEAIHRAGMVALGVGAQARGAEVQVDGLSQVTVGLLEDLFRRHSNPVNPYLETNVAKVKAEQGSARAGRPTT